MHINPAKVSFYGFAILFKIRSVHCVGYFPYPVWLKLSYLLSKDFKRSSQPELGKSKFSFSITESLRDACFALFCDHCIGQGTVSKILLLLERELA